MFTPIRKIARALRVPSVAEREMNYLNGARESIVACSAAADVPTDQIWSLL